jgi:hypothetical protein
MSLFVDGESSFQAALHGGVPFHVIIWVGVLFKVHFKVDVP